MGSLDTVWDAELVQDVGYVDGGGAGADVEAGGDLAVAQAGGQRVEHVALAASKGLQRRGDGGRLLRWGGGFEADPGIAGERFDFMLQWLRADSGGQGVAVAQAASCGGARVLPSSVN